MPEITKAHARGVREKALGTAQRCSTQMRGCTTEIESREALQLRQHARKCLGIGVFQAIGCSRTKKAKRSTPHP